MVFHKPFHLYLFEFLFGIDYTQVIKNIYKKFEQEFYTNKESEEKKEERITIDFVDDENFEKENLKSNNTIIPKSYKNKLDNLNKSNTISDEEYQSVIDELENLQFLHITNIY